MALQSELLSAWILGVKSVLCLTGDFISVGDHPQAKPVFVTLRRPDGGLRGCIGHLSAVTGSLAEEIASCAVAADPIRRAQTAPKVVRFSIL